jgi:voltage-gated potassium channel
MKKMSTLVTGWKWFWPQTPLALFLIVAGILNILGGFHADLMTHLTRGALDVSEISGQNSLAVLGSGAQIILGAGLLLSGIALFWKLQVAWVFALLLLGITIALNAAKLHFGGSLIIPVVAFVLLLVLHRNFNRQTALGSALMSTTGIVGVLAYGTFGMYLLGDQFNPPIKSLLTSLYFTVETLSTTGYGDYAPVTQFAQGYMITLWVVGLSVFATALFSILGPALSHHFDRLFKPSGAPIVKKDHVIIVGSGPLAKSTAQDLLRQNTPFIQVVGLGQEPPLEDQPSISGDISSAKTLKEAGIMDARLFIVATDKDNENAFVVLAAKDLNNELKVLAVANNVEATRRLKLANADMVFTPTDFGGRLLAGLARDEPLPEAFGDLLK